MIRWCVAYTHSGKENLAAGQLAAQGFKTYLPKYRKTVRHARKVRDIKAPLFPRYLFCRCRSRLQSLARDQRNTGYLLHLNHGRETVYCSGGYRRRNQITRDPGTAYRTRTKHSLRTRRQSRNHCRRTFSPSWQLHSRRHESTIVMLLQLLGRELEVRIQTEDVQAYA